MLCCKLPIQVPIYLLCYLCSFHSKILQVVCDHFWLWCLHLEDSNSTWWQHNKLHRPLVQLCSTFFGSLKKCEIRMQLEILCHHVPVSTGLCRHHLMCQYRLYISCWDWGIVELVPVLWNLLVAGRLHDVWSPFKLNLLPHKQGQWFGYLCKILDKFSIVSYQSKKCTDLFGSCWWVHLLE